MLPSSFTLYLLSLLQIVYASDVTETRVVRHPLLRPWLGRRGEPSGPPRNVPSAGFHNPYDGGGTLFTVSGLEKPGALD